MLQRMHSHACARLAPIAPSWLAVHRNVHSVKFYTLLLMWLEEYVKNTWLYNKFKQFLMESCEIVLDFISIKSVV